MRQGFWVQCERMHAGNHNTRLYTRSSLSHTPGSHSVHVRATSLSFIFVSKSLYSSVRQVHSVGRMCTGNHNTEAVHTRSSQVVQCVCHKRGNRLYHTSISRWIYGSQWGSLAAACSLLGAVFFTASHVRICISTTSHVRICIRYCKSRALHLNMQWNWRFVW